MKSRTETSNLHRHLVNSPGSLTNTIIGFCQFARNHGLHVGIQETMDSLQAATTVAMLNKQTFKFALKALLCSSKDDSDRFNSLFNIYWENTSKIARKSSLEVPAKVHMVEREGGSLFSIGNQDGAASEEGKTVSGASVLERLRKTDFSKMPQSDMTQLEALALLLWKQMSMRLTRRLKSNNLKQKVNLRRTIRQNIHYGGDPIELNYQSRKRRRPGLVVLLDVSGSMDRYSFFLLKFIYALQKYFERVESFIFSTRLTHITDALKTHTMPDTLKKLSNEAEAWSSGTRIGECIREFNQSYARRALSRHSLVIILSDGLDTGEPEMLGTELAQLKRRTKKLIWLNPLLGMQDYQPLTRGIRAALPFIDTFISAHNLDSLLELERYLIDVW